MKCDEVTSAVIATATIATVGFGWTFAGLGALAVVYKFIQSSSN